ncbi:hypothetical protein FHS27_006106 [Rhodopirellula rubra]|uniref:Uncharacterized protein n=1 Tax=Aporhodopirellula rubra TaxID=980271 RepID=A0A7W5E5S7_9BACT|nr:hypothetical protein [Aporhodopirellula rubra]
MLVSQAVSNQASVEKQALPSDESLPDCGESMLG